MCAGRGRGWEAHGCSIGAPREVENPFLISGDLVDVADFEVLPGICFNKLEVV